MPAGGPTTVESAVRRGLAVITLRGRTPTTRSRSRRSRGSRTPPRRWPPTRRCGCCDHRRRHADLLVRRRPEGAPGPAGRARSPAAAAPRCDRIAALDVPTVALLNGHVVGGGIDLALACDWRIAVEGAKLRFIHNELGLLAAVGRGRAARRAHAGRHRAAALRDVRARLGRRRRVRSASSTRSSPPTSCSGGSSRSRSGIGRSDRRRWPGDQAAAAAGRRAEVRTRAVRRALGREARYPAGMSLTEDEDVFEALRVVEDPELGMDVVDLGLVYDVRGGRRRGRGHLFADLDGVPGRSADRAGHPGRGRRAWRASATVTTELVFDPRGRRRGCPTTPSSCSASEPRRAKIHPFSRASDLSLRLGFLRRQTCSSFQSSSR